MGTRLTSRRQCEHKAVTSVSAVGTHRAVTSVSHCELGQLLLELEDMVQRGPAVADQHLQAN